MSEQISFGVLLADTIGDLHEIPLAVTGSWVKDGHRFSITRADLDDIVKNFEKRGNGQIVVDFEHASERPEVARGGPVPAAGWIHELTVRDSADGKSTLYGEIEWEPDAKKMLRSGKYRFFSPAIDWGAVDKKTGRSRGATITSGALTNHPFLEELPAIQLSETAGGRVLDKLVVRLGDVSLDQKRAAINEAIREQYGNPLGSPICEVGNSLWVKDVFEDYAIVETGGKLYKFAYSMGDDGDVTLEKPVQVNIEYVEASEVKRVKNKHDKEDNMEFHEVDGSRNDPFARDGDQGSRSSKRREAERRAAKIDEPGDDETEVLRDDGERVRVPRLRLRRMRAADGVGKLGHHAVIAADGRIAGFVSHGDLMAHAKQFGEEVDDRKPAGKEVDERTTAFMREPGNEKLSYARALSQVLMADTDLRDRYNNEQTKVLL